MDLPEYSSLRAALRDVPDPRQPRGRRYPWPLLLTLIAAALASGQRSGRAIGQWVGRARRGRWSPRSPRRAAGCRAPPPCAGRCGPSTWRVGGAAGRLRRRPAGAAPAAAAGGWAGVAWTARRCAGPTGTGRASTWSAWSATATARVLGQVAVAAKSNEITAAPRLLAGRDLAGVVVTMDAQLTQRALARQIRAQRGHYLMVVKANQPALSRRDRGLFASRRLPLATRRRRRRRRAPEGPRPAGDAHAGAHGRPQRLPRLAGGRAGAAADLPAGHRRHRGGPGGVDLWRDQPAGRGLGGRGRGLLARPLDGRECAKKRRGRAFHAGILPGVGRVASGTGVGSRGSPGSGAPATMWRWRALYPRALLARAWLWLRKEVPCEASHPGPSAYERARMEEAECVPSRCTRSLPRGRSAALHTPARPAPERGNEPCQAYRHNLRPREDAPSVNLGTSGGSPLGEWVSLRLASPLGRSPAVVGAGESPAQGEGGQLGDSAGWRRTKPEEDV